MRLKDKVAIVTGGAEGIGKFYCTGFAKEGARVVIADINAAAANRLADELNKQKTEAIAIKTDVSIVKDTEEMVKKTMDRFGKVDILINNAAMYVRAKISRLPLYQIDPEEWNRVMAVNITGTFLCCRAVLPHMMKQKSGKIINIGSALAFSAMMLGMSHYTTSKGGILGLTRALAREVGDYNINVNCICPGSTMSEDDREKAKEFRKVGVGARAIKRIELPEDLVGTAVFLASAESDFITGQTLVVDGGTYLH